MGITQRLFYEVLPGGQEYWSLAEWVQSDSCDCVHCECVCNQCRGGDFVWRIHTGSPNPLVLFFHMARPSMGYERWCIENPALTERYGSLAVKELLERYRRTGWTQKPVTT